MKQNQMMNLSLLQSAQNARLTGGGALSLELGAGGFQPQINQMLLPQRPILPPPQQMSMSPMGMRTANPMSMGMGMGQSLGGTFGMPSGLPQRPMMQPQQQSMLMMSTPGMGSMGNMGNSGLMMSQYANTSRNLMSYPPPMMGTMPRYEVFVIFR